MLLSVRGASGYFTLLVIRFHLTTIRCLSSSPPWQTWLSTQNETMNVVRSVPYRDLLACRCHLLAPLIGNKGRCKGLHQLGSRPPFFCIPLNSTPKHFVAGVPCLMLCGSQNGLPFIRVYVYCYKKNWQSVLASFQQYQRPRIAQKSMIHRKFYN